MKIESSNNNQIYINNPDKLSSPKSEKTVQTESTIKPGDKIEISAEAKLLINNNIAAKDVQSIKEKIKSNFYDSDEVLGKVANAILKDLNPSVSDSET